MGIVCNYRKQQFWPWLAVIIGALPVGAALSTSAKEPAEYVQEFKTQLIQKIMPYWYDTAIDNRNGGYVLSDDAAKKSPPPTEKQLVTQSRMIWGFSHAHLKHLEDGKRDYLKAAEQGYRFLMTHFLDTQNQGYFWTTDLTGRPLDQRKLVYGESFVIYSLVEYYRASGSKEALQHAMDLYQVLQQHAHDTQHGGWVEHFERDWKPILNPDAQVIVELAGRKSANTHLHLMEALTELYQATRDKPVRKSLEEALNINKTQFYPPDPAKSALHRQLDWQPVNGPSSGTISYGHDVEFAWLMVHAETILKQKPSWSHFEAELEYALKYGYDHTRGGLFSTGAADQPASNTEKIWWVEAEMLAALTDSLRHAYDPDYSQALDQLLQFITTYQANPADGIWLDTVNADGSPKSTAKAHNWKANYHDVRAMVKFVEAFSPRQSGAR